LTYNLPAPSLKRTRPRVLAAVARVSSARAMVDWHSPEVITRTSVAFSNIAHFTIGAYMIEFLGSLEFEWQVLTGKRSFKAPCSSIFIVNGPSSRLS